MLIPITLTRIAASVGNVASFGVPFARGVVTRTRQITAGGRSLNITPTLYWYDSSNVATSIKAVRIQLNMPESSLSITLDTSNPMPDDWPLASVPFADVSVAVTHTRPIADYTIVQNGTLYEFAAQNTRDLPMFDAREPAVIAQFADSYLASTGLFGPLLSASQVAADPGLAGVKYLSDTFGPAVTSAVFQDTWPASSQPAIGTYAPVTVDPAADTISWPGGSDYGYGYCTSHYTLEAQLILAPTLPRRVFFKALSPNVLPAPLVNYQTYYARDITGPTTYPECRGQVNTFKVSLTEGGPAIDLTTAGVGTVLCYIPTDAIQVPQPIEGFLYDRATTSLLALAHTNDSSFIRVAYRYAWFYGSLIKLDTPERGVWMGKPRQDSGLYDTKYSHSRGLYYYYALTGDEAALEQVEAIADLWKDDAYFSKPYQALPLGQGKIRSSTGLWTERLLGAAFEGTFYGFMATGSSSYIAAFLALLETAYLHISTQEQDVLDSIIQVYTFNGVNYTYPPQNAWIHNAYQHAENSGCYPWVSAWMSELTVAPLLAYQEQYNTDDRVDEIFIRLGRFLRDTGISYKAYTTWGYDTFLHPAFDPDEPPAGRIALVLYGSGRFSDEDLPPLPIPPWTLPQQEAYNAWKATGRFCAPDGAEQEHTPDATAVTVTAQRGLVRHPALDEGVMAPFMTERECDEAMHHELSYVARTTLLGYNYATYRDPSRPSGTHHTQASLAAAYAGGASGIWEYIQSHKVAWPKYSIFPQRKLSWWFNNSILQFGLMQEAGFDLPVIIKGWVEMEPEEPAVPQVTYPGEDISDGTWTASTGSDLSAMVDEPDTPDDADFMTSSAYPVDDTAVLSLPNVNRPLPGPCTLTIRAQTITTAPPGPLMFEEVTAQTGLPEIMQAWYDQRVAVDPSPLDPTKPYHWWPSMVCGGDFAGLGRPDIVVTHHGVPGSKFFRNIGNNILGVPQFVDATAEVTLSGSFADVYGDGAAYVIDWNNDGYPDILGITDEGAYSGLALNDGTGRFNVQAKAVDISQMHLEDASGNGRMDLMAILPSYKRYINNGDGTYTLSTTYVQGDTYPFDESMRLSVMEYASVVTFSNSSGKLQVNWPSTQMALNANVLFRVSGGGVLPSPLVAGTTYYVVTKGVGTFRLATTPGGTAIDYVDSGTPTVEAYTTLTWPSCRKVNLGGSIGEVVLINWGEGYNFHKHPQQCYAIKYVGGAWVDITGTLGLPTYQGFIAAVYDFNRNGYLDILITDSASAGIYRNYGSAPLIRQLDDIASDLSSTQRDETTLCDIADFNEDGRPEILLQGYRFGYESRLYQDMGDSYARALSFSPPQYACQFVVADFDGDGRLDIMAQSPSVTGYIGGPRLFLNRTPAAGNWINVKLSGVPANKVGIDALVEVYTAGHLGEAGYRLAAVRNNTAGSRAHLSICAHGHSLGGNLPIHVGLGPASTVDVRVTYPGGTVESTTGVATNQTITL